MLFTFPSRYWFTIGLSRVFSLAGWSRLIHAGFLVTRATQDTNRLRRATRTGLSPSAAPLSRGFRSRKLVPQLGPTTPRRPEPPGFGLFPGRSPLLGESLLFSLPAGTKMFQFPAFASIKLWIACLQHAGLSHSGIPGSMVTCTCPGLIAAYHALHRL